MISVLYVDDEKDLLILCKLFLERTGEFLVDTCISAAGALEKLKTCRYDLILSDYLMPGMDGIEFLIRFRSAYGDIPFILFTGRGREEVIIDAINNGVDFYLQKGGDPRSQFAELAHKIKKAVERYRAVKALEKNEERMRLALEGTNDGLWDLNLKTDEMFLDQKGCELLGYTPDEQKKDSHNWRCFVHPDDDPALQRALARYYEGKTDFFQAEQRIRMKSGEWRWILTRGKIVERDEAGVPVRMAGIHTDIMDRKSMEMQLVRSKKDWETIFRAIGNPLVIVAPDHSIIDANESVLSLTGRSMDEIKGMKCWELFHGPVTSTPVTECPMEMMIRSGRTETGVIKLQALDGEYVISCTPVTDDTGKLVKAIHIATDITENIRLEAALSENRDYLNQIFNSVSEGIAIVDAETYEIIDVNPAALKMIGAKREDLVHQVCLSYICPADTPMYPEQKPHDPVDDSELTLLTTEGEKIPIIKHIVPFNLHGKNCLLATFIDNTSRKNAEEQLMESFVRISKQEEELRRQYDTLVHLQSALQESERKFRTIVETSPDLIWSIDTEGIIEYISMRCFQILGYTVDELIGKSLFSLLLPDIIPIVQTALLDDALDPALCTLDVQVMHKDGHHLFLNIRALSHFDDTGNLIGFQGTASDITERKKAEIALIESENRFHQVSETAGVWIWEVDENGVYLYSSPVVKDILGYSPDDLVGKKHFYDLFAPEVKTELTERTIHAFNTRIPFTNFVNKNISKDGDIVILNTTGSPFFDDAGTFLGYRGTDVNITRRIQTEDTLRNVNRQLSLLSSITRHDILNKISIILGFIYVMEEESDDPQMHKYLETLKSSVKTIQSQINFTRVYQDLGLHDPQWQEPKNIILRLNLPETIHLDNDIKNISVFADMMLEKVFFNLLDNSIRHGECVTCIRVFCEKNGDDVVLIWDDNGIGITQDDKERIFERGVGKNTGLGLFLVREILALTKISIRECGIEGKGARFEMTVPKGTYRILS